MNSFLLNFKIVFKAFIEKTFDVTLVKKKPDVVGMTSNEERAFYAACSKAMKEVDGSIVDLGCWMGSTSAGLAEGLRISAAEFDVSKGKIYGLDTFIWEEWMDFMSPHLYCSYKTGESFLPEARRQMEPYKDVVELVKADLEKTTWDGSPVKILLIDAMKSEELSTAIIKGFYPFLQEGALVIHQDFKHWHTPFIHLIQYRLRNYFDFYEDVPGSGSTAFRLVKPIPEDAIRHAAGFSSAGDAEADQAFAYSISLIESPLKAKIAAAHIVHYLLNNKPKIAGEWVGKYKTAGFQNDHDMIRAVEKYNLLNGSR